MKKTIIWFPQIRYLSLPTYNVIASHFPDYHNVLLDTSAYSGADKPLSLKEKEDCMAVYQEVVIIEPTKSYSSQLGILYEYLKYRELVQQIKTLIIQKNAVAAIFPSDLNFEFRAFSCANKYVKRIVIQPGFKRILPRTEYSLFHRIKAGLFRDLLKVPLFRTNRMFGEQDKDAQYLFWTKKWVKAVNRSVQGNIHLIQGVPSAEYRVATELSTKRKIIADLPVQASAYSKFVSIFLNKRVSVGKQAFEEFADYYIRLTHEIEDAFFVLKIHPQEDRDYCMKLYAELNKANSVLVFNDLDIYALLDSSHLLITQWSSVIMNALYRNIPVVLINPDNRHNMHTWFVGDYPFIANSKQSLHTIVRRALDHPSEINRAVNTFIKDSFGNGWGLGSINAAQIIRRILASTT